MQGGVRSELSVALCNVRADIKRGWTKGKEPREYTQEEFAQLQDKLAKLKEQQIEEQEARRATRVNKHTSAEINRAILSNKEAVQEGTRHSESFFSAIGGAGSSNDLLVQGHALIARAKSMAKDNKEAALAAAKATKLSLRTEAAAAKAEEKTEARASKAATARTLKAEAAASRVEACESKEKQKVERASAKAAAQKERLEKHKIDRAAAKASASRKRKAAVLATDDSSSSSDTSAEKGEEEKAAVVVDATVCEVAAARVLTYTEFWEAVQKSTVEDAQGNKTPLFMKAPKGMTFTEEMNKMVKGWPKVEWRQTTEQEDIAEMFKTTFHQPKPE